MTLGVCISVFVSFPVFIDQGVQVGGRSELRTDGTNVSVCVFLYVEENSPATCQPGHMHKRVIFPVLLPCSSLIEGTSSFKRRGLP